MAFEKIIPINEKMFGTCRFQKRLPEHDVRERIGGNNSLTELCYEIDSSAQKGAIEVLIPVKSKQIAETNDNYDREVRLNGVNLTVQANVKNRNVEGRQATAAAEILVHARSITLLGGVK